MSDFFSSQITRKAQERIAVKEGKVLPPQTKRQKINSGIKSPPKPPKTKVFLTSEEKILQKNQEGSCSACIHSKYKINPLGQNDGYYCDSKYIYAKKLKEGKGNINSSILVITEKFDEKSEMLTAFFEKAYNFTLNDYYYIPALWCLPIPGYKPTDNEAIHPFNACNINHVDKIIKQMNPMVIITIGKAIYSITKDKEISRTALHYAPLYSMKYDTHLLPCPDLAYMIEYRKEPDGSTRRFFQDNYYQNVLKQHVALAKSNNLKKYPKKDTMDIIIQDKQEAENILHKFINSESSFFMFDIESSGLVYMEDEIGGIGICEDSTTSYYILWSLFDASLKNLLNNLFKTKISVGHNGKFDEQFLRYNGISEAFTKEDTMLMSHMLYPEYLQGLKPSAYMFTPYGGYDQELDVYLKDHGLKKYTDAPIEILGPYCCMDVRVTYLLYCKFKRELARNSKLQWLYTNISMPLSMAFSKAEMKGIRVDVDYLDSYSKMKKEELKKAEKEFFEVIGKEINLSSKKVLSEFIQSMNVKKVKDTKKGGFSTDQEAMDIWAKQGHKWAIAYQKWAEIGTQLTSFIGDVDTKETKKNGLYQHIRSDGRIHCSFKIHGTETGRTACIDSESLILGVDGLTRIKNLLSTPVAGKFNDINPLIIYSTNGYKSTSKVFYTGETEVVKFVFQNGVFQYSTYHHPIYTPNEWIETDKLNVGDCIGFYYGSNIYGKNSFDKQIFQKQVSSFITWNSVPEYILKGDSEVISNFKSFIGNKINHQNSLVLRDICTILINLGYLFSNDGKEIVVSDEIVKKEIIWVEIVSKSYDLKETFDISIT